MVDRLAVVALAAVLTACACPGRQSRACRAAPAGRAAPPPPKSGLDLDRVSIAACVRRTTCTASWAAPGSRNTEIPADRSNYGSFIILDDQAQEEVRQLIVAASAQPNRAPGSDAQKVGDYYLAYMDTARVESLGLAPLHAELRAHRRDRDAARRGALHRLLAAHRRRAAVRVVLEPRQQELERVPRRAVPERAHDARPRLLPESRREVRAVPRAASPSTSEQMLALAGERNANSAAARIAALETRIANDQWTKVQNSRPGEDLQPDVAAGVPEARAGLRLAGVLRGHGRAGAASRREPALLHQGRRPAGEDRAGRRLARVFQVPAARRLRAGAVGAVRGPRVRFPSAHPERRGRAAAALAARRRLHGRQHGRAHRPHVRRGAFRRRGQAPHAGAGQQPAQGLRHLDRRARLDEPGDARRGQEEALEDHRQDRLSRQVARLLALAFAATTCVGNVLRARGVRAPALRRRAPAGRSTRASG